VWKIDFTSSGVVDSISAAVTRPSSCSHQRLRLGSGEAAGSWVEAARSVWARRGGAGAAAADAGAAAVGAWALSLLACIAAAASWLLGE